MITILKDVGHEKLNDDHMKIYQVIVKFNNLSKRFITNNEEGFKVKSW